MIGVFDSGFGGLTVLRSMASLPEHPGLVYFGDNARAPYGNRSGEEIVDFTRQGVEVLFGVGCRLVIIACNTATAVALRSLQQDWLPYRDGPQSANVLGIIVPTIEEITGRPDPHDIAVFATTRTVETQVYPIEIAKRRPDVTVYQEACPSLVSAIESGAHSLELSQMIEAHVEALVTRMGHRPRQAVLGCTHYSLLSDLFAKALGPEVEIISQPNVVAASLSSYLIRHPEYDVKSDRGTMRFFTSGFTEKALIHAETFWGGPLHFQKLEV